VSVASPLVVERRGAVVLVTIDLPDTRNALDGEELFAAFERVSRELNADDGVAVAILTGAGRAFSAGGNINAMRDRAGMFGGRPDEIVANYRRGIQRITRAVDALEMPIIAAVNGPAVGAGCDLACFCDIRIAGERASFAESFTKLGIIAGDGGSWILPRLVGRQAASVLAFGGATIDAQTALRLGLVWSVVPDAELLDAAFALAETIAANSGYAVRATKQLMRIGADLPLGSFLDVAASYQATAHHTPAHHEAIAAFFAARKS
jgi:2-(1,2-epoxy-1,2-dihydrophenyl)acetyl-CoA isomerase